MRDVLAAKDAASLATLFRGRIVLIGNTQPYSDRLRVPLNLAAWEKSTRDSPAVVVQAQTLRTAMLGAAPDDASQPLAVVLALLASLPVLLSRRALALAAAAAGLFLVFVGALVALRGGLFVPVSAPLATLLIAAALPFVGRREAFRRRSMNIPHSP
jgi:CHASE2 domain-containing sensor protein